MHKNDRKKIILPILINPNNSSLKTPNKPYINDLHLEQISTNHTYFNSDTKNNSNSTLILSPKKDLSYSLPSSQILSILQPSLHPKEFRETSLRSFVQKHFNSDIPERIRTFEKFAFNNAERDENKFIRPILAEMRSVKWVTEEGIGGGREEGGRRGKGGWDEGGRKMEGGKDEEGKRMGGGTDGGGREEGGGEEGGGYGKWEYYLGRTRIGGGREPLGTMLITDLWSKSLQKECLEKSNMIKEKKMLEKYLFYKNKKEDDEEDDEEEWVGGGSRLEGGGRMFGKRELGGIKRKEAGAKKGTNRIEGGGRREDDGGGRSEGMSDRVDRYIKGKRGFVFTKTLPLNKSLNPEKNDMVKKLKDLVRSIEKLQNENQKDKKGLRGNKDEYFHLS